MNSLNFKGFFAAAAFIMLSFGIVSAALCEDNIAINGNAQESDFPVLNPVSVQGAISMDGGDEEAAERFGYKKDSGMTASNGQSPSGQSHAQSGAASDLNTLDRRLRKELVAMAAEIRELKKQLAKFKEIETDIAGLKKVALMHAEAIDGNARDIDYQYQSLKQLGTSVASSKDSMDSMSKDLASRIDSRTSELSTTNSILNLKVEKSNDDLKTLKILIFCLAFVIALLCVCLYILYRLSRKVSGLKKAQEKQKDNVKIVSFDTKSDKNTVSTESKTESNEEKAPSNQSADDEDTRKKSEKMTPRPFHNLVLRMSDDIAKMETDLYGADSQDEKYRALAEAVLRKKKIATDNGYTVTGFTGQNYSLDMPYEAEFIKDKSLTEGTAIICGMLKMQVEYKGQIVQQAKLLVKENY